MALWAQDAAEIQLTEGRIDGVPSMGALALDGATVLLDRVDVSGLGRTACTTSCAPSPDGTGVAAIAGGSIEGAELRVHGGECGLLTDAPAALGVSGTVEGSANGVCLQMGAALDLEALAVDLSAASTPTRATSYSLPLALVPP